MAHFYVSATGKAKHPATLCGTKQSGLTIRAGGWTLGVEVDISHNETTGMDVIEVRQTGKSTDHGYGKPSVTFSAPA